MKSSLLISALLWTSVVGAQHNFRFKASLGTVDREAFYKIELTPQMVARCQPALADFRIKDEKGVQVPYLLKADQPVFNEQQFIAFPIVHSRREADKLTHVVIQNPLTRPLDNLLLVIRNTEARRQVTVSGSDDTSHWYVIRENIFLESYFSQREDFLQSLSFPPSRYKYFQVTILGENVLPVNIVKAGVYKESFTGGKYVLLPSPAISQKDSSDNNSYITLQFAEPFAIDKLDLSLTGPKFYRRPVSFYAGDDPVPVYQQELSSPSPASFPVNFRSRTLRLVVTNQDNPPLHLAAAQAWQLNQYLLAYLKPGSPYEVFFGDSTAASPSYDLEFFKDSIGKNPAILRLGAIGAMPRQQPPAPPRPLLTKPVLWTAIALVLVILLLFTIRLTKEVNKRSEA